MIITGMDNNRGTFTTPIFGSIVQNGKFALWAFAFDKQLKRVDFPTFGNPTIPRNWKYFWLLALFVRTKTQSSNILS